MTEFKQYKYGTVGQPLEVEVEVEVAASTGFARKVDKASSSMYLIVPGAALFLVACLTSLMWGVNSEAVVNPVREVEVGAAALCGGESAGLKSGFVNVDHGERFYLFAESIDIAPEEAPLVIWLSGGPGCSSLLAAILENGPCSGDGFEVNEDGSSNFPLVSNPYAWNRRANVIWIDQPQGVGYSTGPVKEGEDTDDEAPWFASGEAVSKDMVQFMNAWIDAHPEYRSRDLFVFGESYGGHYVPAVAAALHAAHGKDEAPFVNLQGVAIGNGLTNPYIQYAYYPQMANSNTYGIQSVSNETLAEMELAVEPCLDLIKACAPTDADVNTVLIDDMACGEAYMFCNSKLVEPYAASGRSVYDIRTFEDSSVKLGLVNEWGNLPEIQRAFGLPEGAGIEYQACSKEVYLRFLFDFMQDYEDAMGELQEANNIPMLIYAGDADYICNWMGNDAWTRDLDPGIAGVGENDFVLSDGTVGARYRTTGQLTFMRIFGAGHMVPMDQPETALAMLNDFISGELYGGRSSH